MSTYHCHPELSDDETSEVSEEDPRTVVEKGGEKTPSAKAESLRVNSEDEKDVDDAEDDDEEIGEDELVRLRALTCTFLIIAFRYIVEAILSHVIDEEVSSPSNFSSLSPANGSGRVARYFMKSSGKAMKRNPIEPGSRNPTCYNPTILSVKLG